MKKFITKNATPEIPNIDRVIKKIPEFDVDDLIIWIEGTRPYVARFGKLILWATYMPDLNGNGSWRWGIIRNGKQLVNKSAMNWHDCRYYCEMKARSIRRKPKKYDREYFSVELFR